MRLLVSQVPPLHAKLPKASEEPLRLSNLPSLQGYLAHNDPPPPLLGPYSRTMPRALWGSQGMGGSYDLLQSYTLLNLTGGSILT